MITDLKVADKMMVVAPLITIWSARTKMQPEDYGLDKTNLPPEELATLGVKKLCPPEKLRPFAMLKSRTVSLLSRHGIPFLPGAWLVPADKATDINKALAEIQADFDAAKESFLAEYDAQRHRRQQRSCVCHYGTYGQVWHPAHNRTVTHRKRFAGFFPRNL